MCFPLKDEKSFLAIMDTLFLQQQPLPRNSLLTFLGRSHYPREGRGERRRVLNRDAELSPVAVEGRGAGRDLRSPRRGRCREEAEAVRVLVALLSPAAAIPPLRCC